MESEMILLLLLAGSLAGFIAGLFGVGGGIIAIPVCLWVLDRQGVEPTYIQHLAVGTSFSVMMFTTFMSSLAQYLRKSIRWDILRAMAPGVVLGSIAGSLVAPFISSPSLQVLFVVMAYAIAIQTLVGFSPSRAWSLPRPAGIFGVGGLIGGISSLMGVGGGVFMVPFMLGCRVPVKEAVGSSAALTWAIAMSGALAYLLSGLRVERLQESLPDGALGFWYLPVALVMVVSTILFAPLGVRLAHRLPSLWLQRAFGILLLLVITQLLLKWVL